MKNKHYLLWLLVGVACWSGCDNPNSGSVPSPRQQDQHPDWQVHGRKPPAQQNEQPEIMTAQASESVPDPKLTKLVQGPRTGSASADAIKAMHALLEEWQPVGKSVRQVKAVLGLPSEENDRRIIFRFGDGDIVYEWSFRTDKGFVRSVEKKLLE
jgi:hypothetical protein